VVHRWLDTDRDPVGKLLRERAGIGVDGPVVVFPRVSRALRH
jgi:hypothetical protein